MKKYSILLAAIVAVIAVSFAGATPQAVGTKLGLDPKTGVITACIEPTSTAVSKESRSDLKFSCVGKGYKTVKWNVRGPQGAKGDAGANGTNGLNGATGGPGPQGAQGATGAAGTNGTNGVDGDDGLDGEDGATGPAGPQGLAGADGEDGEDGADSQVAGPQGEQGIQGEVGPAGPAGPQGTSGVTNLESDGPYPGATDLGSIPGNGDNSDTMWANDGTLQQSWVMCAEGKTALGGGFRVAADAGDAAAKAVQVSASEPTQVVAGALVYNPIPGDAAGSLVPNGWLVEGFNTGTAPVIVRPWVICANVG